MASASGDHIRYYDCTTASSPARVSGEAVATSAAATAGCTFVVSALTCTGYTSHAPLLVEAPGHWDEEDHLAFARMVNVHTKTFWLVSMVLAGPIIIPDPVVEQRTMKDFIPLLKMRASAQDREVIDRFFEEHAPLL